METKEAEQKEITIYWWNFGTKTLDHKGSYKEFLDKKDIRVRQINHPIHKGTKGYRFNMPIGSSIIHFDTFDGDYINCLTSAIKLFLTYLGNKTLFINNYGMEYRLNWR